MRRKVVGLVACFGMLIVGCGNSISTSENDGGASEIAGSDASVVDEPPGAIDEINLINGTVVDQSLYPASVMVTSGGGSCTGTVVGKNVMIIAAHCVDHGATATFSAGGKRYSSVCSQASLYRRDVDHDLALCRTSQEITGIEYENISVTAGLVQPGAKVLLTGYGCRDVGGSGGADGKYRIGEATVSRLPQVPYNYDYVTENGGALCFGDSGGPAFYSPTGDASDRVVISVNSKGNIRDISYITDLSTQASTEFIKLWTEHYSLEICGYNQDAEGCRDSTINPDDVAPISPDRISQECINVEKNGTLIKLHSCVLDANKNASYCQDAERKVNVCLDTKPW